MLSAAQNKHRNVKTEDPLYSVLLFSQFFWMLATKILPHRTFKDGVWLLWIHFNHLFVEEPVFIIPVSVIPQNYTSTAPKNVLFLYKLIHVPKPVTCLKCNLLFVSLITLIKTLLFQQTYLAFCLLHMYSPEPCVSSVKTLLVLLNYSRV